jgi:hypothetical protein
MVSDAVTETVEKPANGCSRRCVARCNACLRKGPMSDVSPGEKEGCRCPLLPCRGAHFVIRHEELRHETVALRLSSQIDRTGARLVECSQG